MKLSRRSYPYPVVGNLDDVPGAAFQATVEMIADQETVYLDVSIQHSSVTLSHLATTAKAAYVVHVECTNTLFRRLFQLRETTDRIPIRADQLNDLVEVNVFAVATQDISGYVVEGAHSDYEGSAFEVRKADILALGEGRIFIVESSFDVLGRVGSIMQIESATEEGDFPMRLDFNGEKIRVILSREDFKEYKLLRHDEALSTVITTSIVLPALMEALHYIGGESDADDGDVLGSLRWHRILNRRIEAMKLQDETDKLTQAQRLLELPIRRALVTAHSMAEASA